MAGTDFRMPGAYQLEGSNAAGQVLSPRLFRPPLSPSSSSYNLAKSTGSFYSDASMNSITPAANAKRKRAQDRGESPIPFDGEDVGMGFANTKYTLAGQIDTPGSAQHDHDNAYSDADYRRALGTNKAPDELESPATRHTSIFPRIDPPTSAHSVAWSTFALSALGGVVGKVWQFCTAGAFRGFYAGGGNGYHLDGKTEAESGNPWPSEHDLPNSGHDTHSDPVPGGFPRSDYMPYMSEHDGMSTREASPGLTPSAKRRQTSEPDDLRKNWVMVEEPREGPSRRHTSSSKPGKQESKARNRQPVSGASAATNRRINTPVSRLEKWTPSSCIDRTSLRISHAGSPKLSAREPASFASSRSPGSRIPVPVHQSSGKPSACASSVSQLSNPQRQLPSPATHRRNQSTSAASGRSVPRWRGTIGARLDVDDIQASPRLDAEAKQLAQRKLAAEKEADARVDYMNARLGDMIRQCEEALGTKIEVYGEDGGTGWMHDGD